MLAELSFQVLLRTILHVLTNQGSKCSVETKSKASASLREREREREREYTLYNNITYCESLGNAVLDVNNLA